MASWWSAKPDEDRKSSWAGTNGNKRWPASSPVFSLSLSLIPLRSYFFPHCYEITRFVRRRRRLRKHVTIRQSRFGTTSTMAIQSILAAHRVRTPFADSITSFFLLFSSFPSAFLYYASVMFKGREGGGKIRKIGRRKIGRESREFFRRLITRNFTNSVYNSPLFGSLEWIGLLE